MPLRPIAQEKFWKKVRINRPGIISLYEFEQGIFEDLGKLQDIHGAKYIRDPWVLLPFCDESGNPLNLTDGTGSAIKRIQSSTYRSAASDFSL